MRHLPLVMLGLMPFALVGCAAAEHTPAPFALAGQPLAVVVDLRLDKGEPASGTAYFRPAGGPQFQPVTLQPRGDEQLWASLPTGAAAAGSVIEYYVDVEAGAKFVAFGSVAEPYRVPVVDEVEASVLRMKTWAARGTAGQDITIYLETRGQPIEAAEVLYEPPYLPGETRAPMWGDGERYVMFIPGYAVRDGDWRYAVLVWINGKSYRLPREGKDVIFVSPRQREANPFSRKERR